MCYTQILTELLNASPVVNPSLLSCDFAHLEEEIRRLEQAGALMLHLDIMDGHFAPNLSIGVPVVEAVRRSTDLPLDVHLMLSEPERYIETFRSAGADMLTFHIEAEPNARPLLEKIHKLGAAAGIALNPQTPVSDVESCLDLCDLVLVMSVIPGFGGQIFDPVALDKLRQLRGLAGPKVLLSVDGGINHKIAGAVAQAGVDLLVTGSALFSSGDYGKFIEEMTALAVSAKQVQV